MSELIKKAVASTVGDDPLSFVMSDETVDRVGDVIEARGWNLKNFLKNPIALFNHDPRFIVGHWTDVKVHGDKLVGKLNLLPKGISERLDEIRAIVEAGVLRAVSVGFSPDPDQMELTKSGGWRFKAAELMECSLVSIPANPNALQMAKSLKLSDDAQRIIFDAHDPVIKKFDIGAPAIGQQADGDTGRKAAPGASGKSNPIVKLLKPKETKTMATKTLADQISAFEATRASKAAELETIVLGTEGETLDADQAEKADTLEGELKSLDDHIKRLRAVETVKAANAKPIKDIDTEQKSVESRSPVVVKNTPKLDAGIAFARIAKVKGLARLDGESPREIAKNLYGEDSVVYGHFTKAAVSAANGGSAPWAGNLVTDGGAFADFVEFLRPQTILGKFGTGNIPGLRRIPFDTPVLIQSTGGVGYWVGEGKAKPLTSWTTSRTTMTALKVATIAAITEEMLRRSSIDADTWIRDELARAVAARIDQTFIDPAAAAVAGVSPASITNGVSAVISSGNDADAVRADIRALSATFRATNNSASGTVWVMPESTAEALSMMLNPLGQPEFGGITSEGGTFLGKPVITSEYVPTAYDPDGAGSATSGAIVALVKASDVFYGDEGGVAVDFSREASLEMADNPTGSSVTPTAASMVSMFQTNSVAFRAERTLNWMKRRPEAVAVLGSVNWGE